MLLAFSIDMREQCAATKLSIGYKTKLRKKSSGPGPYPGLEQCRPCGERGPAGAPCPQTLSHTRRELKLQVGNYELTWAQPLSSCCESAAKPKLVSLQAIFVAWISELDDPK